MMPTGREQPVRAVCDGVPVYGFGYTYVLGVSPDLVSGAPLQEGNGAAVTKIRPKKSWEIQSNRMGATSPRIPRSPLNDPQPQLAIRLIDGVHQGTLDEAAQWTQLADKVVVF